MDLQYIIKETDYIQFYLYEASIGNIKKKRMEFVLKYSLCIFLFGIFSFFFNNISIGVFLLVLSIIVFFIVPIRLKKVYFNDINNFVKSTYKCKITKFNIDDKFINIVTENSVNKYFITSLEEIIEMNNCFYLKIAEYYLIVPRFDINIIDTKNIIINFSNENKIKYTINLEWKW